MRTKELFAAIGILLLSNVLIAREFRGEGKRSQAGSTPGTAANCSPPVAATDLDINNTRALIQTGGDMWWDLVGQAKYEIPKGSGNTALFAGSLWLGGQDASGQLKVAAQRFRQSGNDFWTGPLNVVTGEIDPATCVKWDKHFLSYRQQVVNFDAWFQNPDDFPEYSVPDIIKNWPAHGDPANNEATYLAPFYDRNGDGFYNYEDGDYPGYDLSGNVDCQGRLVNIYGDQNLWWVFNDKGNIHTETGEKAIGMEIRAQAFAFATNDEVNNMTFYNYELHNRSTFDLRHTYFGFWVDADLGNAQDDFVGCDVERGLGYCYNGDNLDEDLEGAKGYGETPPAIGVDFFQGPFQDVDGRDNCLCSTYIDAIKDDGIVYNGSGVGYGDGIPDNERLGMRAFLYHNRDNTVTGDPRTGQEYYNYLRSIWRDNTKMVYGGTGHQNSVSPPYVEADFMFPGDSDPLGWGTGGVPQPEWTEVTANNSPFDRRFIQSAGEFELTPGAVNNITVGVVWARALTGGPLASVKEMLQADTKTQALFDNCFQLLDGPDAPEMEITELDRKLIFKLFNRSGNNVNDDYAEVDPFIPQPDSVQDDDGNWIFPDTDPILYDSLVKIYRTYRFQGYQVFQLKDASVSAADLYNNDLARLVFQCDIKDDVMELTNFRFDKDLNANIPEPRVEMANNDGIYKTFILTEDAFAEGDRRLVNYRTYYYMAIAYAHNEYKKYDPNDPFSLDGQKQPYLPSRKSPSGAILAYSAIPHKTEMQKNGMVLNAEYGDGIDLVRIEGLGNGGTFLEMDVASREEAMKGEPWIVENPKYLAGNTPIEVKVVDPLGLRKGDYTIAFKDTTGGSMADAYFEITGGDLPEALVSKSRIGDQKEEVFPELGISITVKDVENPWYDKFTNGLIGSKMEFADVTKVWLTGIVNVDGNNYQNWIRSGRNAEKDLKEYWDYDHIEGETVDKGIDNDEYYEGVIGGTWAPVRLASWNTHNPASNKEWQWTSKGLYLGLPISSKEVGYQLSYLHSVDVVITSDKSKWTRCPVVELSDDPVLAVGGAKKLYLRESPSVDKDGNPATPGSGPSDNPDDANYISDVGMGWFPGYAIDLETGERLNMAFGEDSYLTSENGADMLWNPTDKMYEGVGNGNIRFGGKHYIYVFRNNIVEEDKYQLPKDYNQAVNRMPGYDAGKFMYEKLSQKTKAAFAHVWRAGMWVGAPILEFNRELLETDVTIKLRVNRKYTRYAVGNTYSIGDVLEAGKEYLVLHGPVSFLGVKYTQGDVIKGNGNTALQIALDGSTGTDPADWKDNVVETVNGGLPMYQFSITGEQAPATNVESVAKEALDLIQVVPNPYYAYSEYELDKTDFRVKITNLPMKCKVRIFTVNGVLVREFTKDDDSVTFIEWDLKNHARIPIASGMYIIHVEVPGVGEKVLKWFGVMRPVDLDSF